MQNPGINPSIFPLPVYAIPSLPVLLPKTKLDQARPGQIFQAHSLSPDPMTSHPALKCDDSCPSTPPLHDTNPHAYANKGVIV